MSVGSVLSTNSILLDNMQMTARIAAQNISSNLHLLTERMYRLSLEPVFTDGAGTITEKQEKIDEAKLQIEFVWLAAYDTAGQKLYGGGKAPSSIADIKYYSHLKDNTSYPLTLRLKRQGPERREPVRCHSRKN